MGGSVNSTDVLVPYGPDGPIGAGAASVVDALDGDVAALARTASFEGKPGQSVLVPSRSLAKYTRPFHTIGERLVPS